MSTFTSTFTFSPARRTGVGLLIGLCGGTGSGKTFSALRLATGMARGKRFCLIDTEAGRALHYADRFAFDHGDLKPPFRPEAYADAIAAADAAGYPVVVVDSMSHSWAGEGGCLDWQEEELNRMAGDDWRKREACRMASWIRPKISHKKMVARLLQVRAHVILCFRAEEKIEMVKDTSGKLIVRPRESVTGLDGWVPVAEKSLPYELTASFLLTADAPGVPKPIKLQEQHRAMFPTGSPVAESAGEQIAKWAGGGTDGSAKAPPTPGTLTGDGVTADTRAEPPPSAPADLAARLRKLGIESEHLTECLRRRGGRAIRLDSLTPAQASRLDELLSAVETGETRFGQTVNGWDFLPLGPIQEGK